MMKGWVRLHRQIEHWKFYFKEPFDRSHAWIDLFMLANHANGNVVIRGNIIEIKRGQVGYSDLQLSRRWQWSRKKVENFLNWLEKDQQIVQQKNRLLNIKTIINYDKYQPEVDNRVDNRVGTNNNNNNNNNENKLPPYPPRGDLIRGKKDPYANYKVI